MKSRALLLTMGFLLTLVLVVTCVGCNDDDPEEDTSAQAVKADKHSSVLVNITSQFLPNGDIVIRTSKDFYDKSGNAVRSISATDTVPGLGTTIDTVSTGRYDEDDNPIDSAITHPKNYQFFITVK